MMHLQLLLVTLIPVLTSLTLYLANEKTGFKEIPYIPKQIIIGVIFGAVAIAGTEFGVKMGTATANVRDAAPLLAGFIFGGPAGIIAGLIGGIERFFATYWGRGEFTQIACSVSTAVAGIYAALLRKYIFDGKRPTWGFGLACGVVMEVFHFTMVFLTNLNESAKAMDIIMILASPMIIATMAAVAIPLLVIQLTERKTEPIKSHYHKIANQIKWWLLGAFIFCYVVSTATIYSIQTNTAFAKAEDTFALTINDVMEDVQDNSTRLMTEKLLLIKEEYDKNPYYSSYTNDCPENIQLRKDYAALLPQYNLTSINVIKKDVYGTFVCSSDPLPGEENGFALDSFYMTQYEGQSKRLHKKMLEPETKMFVQEFGQRSDTQNNKIIYTKYAAITIDDDYYLVIGIDETNFYSMVNEKVSDITSFRHVNINGHILILDAHDKAVSDEEGYSDAPHGLTLESLRSQGKEFTRLRGNIYGQDAFYTYTVVETYTIVIMLPAEEVLSTRDESFVLNSFMEILVFAILFALIYSLIKQSVVNKIYLVNNSLSKIITGNLDVKVNVRSSLEFDSLSNDINYTVDTLKKYIDDAAKRIDEELAFAKTIQLSALPATFPAFPDRTEFDLFATMNTAKEVGGDFYDFYIIDKNKLAFLIADVSGKGIPAAMFMMESKALLKNLAKSLLDANDVVMKTNDALAQNNEAHMFVTCWFGIIDFSTGHVKYANAGHNNPLIYRKNGRWEYIEQKKNIVLGAIEGIPYALQEFDLNPGDRIYLYTDGVTEATRNDKVLYGEERLEKYLNDNIDKNLNDLLLGVKADIDSFVDGADQFDDITMLCLEYKGK